MLRLAAGYHNPPPHSLTETPTMFLLIVVLSLVMASYLSSSVAQEPGLSFGIITGLIVSLATVMFSTTNSCLIQRTMIITAKLVIVFSQTSVHFYFSLVVISVMYSSTEVSDCIYSLGA